MGYIGNFPTAVPLTTNDLADNIVTADKLDLTDDYAFTGTVSGAGGITVAEQWRLTSNQTSDGDVNANISLSNYNGIGNINAGMTQSSGIFTFPSTGIWFIQFNAVLEEGSQSSNDGLTRFRILTTTDNSTYNPVAVAQEGVAGSLFAEFSGHSSVNIIFDVVSTTTHKCKFDVASLTTGNRLVGNANGIYTNFTFIRLGDT